VLISAVEEMPAIVQDALIELLDGLEFTSRPSAAVRLISGTTVSLLERVAAGTFSEQLFYHLNTVHLMACDGVVTVAGADNSVKVRGSALSTPKLPR
jgi:DNA-binding NtrC family response regulator